MRSLNPLWTVGSFHARIAELAALTGGERVLDLGCGRGFTLASLLAGIGMSGEVIAADRSSRSLDLIRKRHSKDIAARRLSVVETDFSHGLAFDSGSFDRVICQNVVECVADRHGLIAEIHRVLKPGGSAIVGHYDFDGVMLASDDRQLTRRLVHGYADYKQAWQDVAEGQMGRLLPGLFAGSPFGDVVTETVLFVDLVLSKDSYAQDHLLGMVELCEKYGVAADAGKAWLHGLEMRSAAGTFYYALPWTYVIAR